MRFASNNLKDSFMGGGGRDKEKDSFMGWGDKGGSEIPASRTP